MKSLSSLVSPTQSDSQSLPPNLLTASPDLDAAPVVPVGPMAASPFAAGPLAAGMKPPRVRPASSAVTASAAKPAALADVGTVVSTPSTTVAAFAEGTGYAALPLAPALQRALTDSGWTTPTPIQAQAIPHSLAGKDVLGCAQTGTGKTGAFLLPLFQRLLTHERAAAPHAAAHQGPAPRRHGITPRPIRALVLAPTRELAQQIADTAQVLGKHTGLTHTVLLGGVSQYHQAKALARGVDLLIATPGRLMDLMQQGIANIARVEFFVVDEVDRMLDQGFWPAVREIAGKLPVERQTCVFSATMPGELEPLAMKLLRSPVRVSVAAIASTPQKIEQGIWHLQQGAKKQAIAAILRQDDVQRAVVFTRSKHGANRLAEHLEASGIPAAAIHGNKSQPQREKALRQFRNGDLPILVATDIMARGIDVDDITHVINFDLPADPESYVHRIGRTARAGRAGTALSLCSPDERDVLRRIERLIGQKIPVVRDDIGAWSPTAAGMGDSEQSAGGRPQGRPQGYSQGRPQSGRPSGGYGGGSGGGYGAAGRNDRRPSGGFGGQGGHGGPSPHAGAAPRGEARGATSERRAPRSDRSMLAK
jgi:ATP-dependent RNA helicase RhlE